MDKNNLDIFKEKSDNTEFIYKMLPSVFMSNGDVQKFNPKSISKSVMEEAGLSRKEARNVTELVVRRIISSGIGFLSGPHIRELVCSALSELNFEEERKLFTRIGMPIHDYEVLLGSKYNERAVEYTAPENIHRWAAGQLASEYTLLKLLTNDQTRSHLSGDIHIHSLRYFDMRPYSQSWDLRMILKLGLPPARFLNLTAAKPAKNAMVAVLHACKWLGVTHSEFSGDQGFLYFNTFISPYLKGLSYKEIKQVAQTFIFETNQQNSSKGSYIPFTSIICSPKVPKPLKNIAAVGPGGSTDGTYKDFADENLMFFNALTEIYAKGDRNGKLLAFPKHKILLDTEWDQNENFYSNIYDEIVNMGTPIFINYSLSWVKEKGYFGPFFTNSQRDLYLQQIDELDLYDWSKKFVNTGGLQSISINLPRISYEANGDDNRLLEILNDQMDLVKGILLIKFNIIKKLIENKQLPLCSGIVKGQPILNLKRQALVFGIVGLNEMITAHTGKQIHEDQSSQMLANEIIKHIIARCIAYTKEHSIFFTVWEQPNEFAPYRFAALDLTHHNQRTISVINGDIENGAVYYTSSIGANLSADIELDKKIDIHSQSASIFQNNSTLQLWLNAAESNKDPKKIQMIITKLLENKTNWFSLNSDFSMCPECYHFMKNSLQKCKKCGFDDKSMKVFSKITDYFSPVELWNPGKKQEFLDRKRISL